MTPKDLKETLASLHTQKLPLFLWGASGIGKSAIVKELAVQRDLECIDLHLSRLDLSDLKSKQLFDDQSMNGSEPFRLPKDADRGGILILDEIDVANPLIQAAAFELGIDRCSGSYHLPDNWAIILSSSTAEYKLAPHIANSFVHLYMEVSVEDWRAWAFKAKIEDSIISFISSHPNALFDYDPYREVKTFATPRSWSFVDTILKSKMKELYLFDAIAGAIGENLATQFLTYQSQTCELPVFHEIFEGRSQHYPEDMQSLHKAATVLVSHALRKPDKRELNHLMRYTLNLHPDFAVKIVSDLQSQGIRFDRLEAWKPWSEKFSSFLG